MDKTFDFNCFIYKMWKTYYTISKALLYVLTFLLLCIRDSYIKFS